MTSQAYQIGPIEAKLRAEAAERRRRFMEAKPPAPRLMLVKPTEDATEAPQRLPVAFDHHVLAYRAQTSGIAYVLYECRQRDMTLDDIRRTNRTHAMVLLRGEIAHTLKAKFKWSYPDIARYLRRDHGTIFHCIDVYCGETGAERGPIYARRKYSAAQFEELKQLFLSCGSIRKAAMECGIPLTTATRKGVKAGWYVEAERPGAKRHILPLEEIEILYRGTMKIREIAAMYGVDSRTLSRVADDMGWPRRGQAKRAGQ
jgi:hypothetical protein